LEELFPERIEEQVGLLAHHWEWAEEPERAIPYLLRAGEQARVAYASEEAIAHFRRALALLAEPPSSSWGESEKQWRLEALKGLGQMYFRVGDLGEAEEHLREAIGLGKEIGVAPRELAWIYHWLGEVMYWQRRAEDRIRIGEEGLALLGDDDEAVEATLMNQTIAMGYSEKGDMAKFREFTFRTAQFIRRLPYSEELGPLFLHIVFAYREEKNAKEAMQWVRDLEERAIPHHDVRALGGGNISGGEVLALTGDLHGAISRYRRALELFAQMDDAKHQGWCLNRMGEAFLALGDLPQAETCARGGLEAAEAVANERVIAWAHALAGQIYLCRGAWDDAERAFRRAVQLNQEIGDRYREVQAAYYLGRACLAQGDRAQASIQFRKVAACAASGGWRRNPYLVANGLSGLEEAHDDPAAFRTLCRRLRSRVSNMPLSQWFLEPAEPRRDLEVDGGGVQDLESAIQEGTWEDPFGDCSFRVHNELEINAANGRCLARMNLGAPRILWPVSPAETGTSGERHMAIQAVCTSASDRKPAIGGILLWKDKQNYLRLDRGVFGEQEITLMGCVGNEDIVIGRGRLESAGENRDRSPELVRGSPQQVEGSVDRVFLRLEWVGGQVDGLCSADGANWFSVGRASFPVASPLQAGLHGIGNVDRTIYHGAYPDGTAIRFESFQLWGVY
jgi:tetratricopeptide (TPR) repeat protein